MAPAAGPSGRTRLDTVIGLMRMPARIIRREKGRELRKQHFGDICRVVAHHGGEGKGSRAAANQCRRFAEQSLGRHALLSSSNGQGQGITAVASKSRSLRDQAATRGPTGDGPIAGPPHEAATKNAKHLIWSAGRPGPGPGPGDESQPVRRARSRCERVTGWQANAKFASQTPTT